MLPPVSLREIDDLLDDMAGIIDEIWRAHGRGQLVVNNNGGLVVAAEDCQIQKFYELLRMGLEREAADDDDN